MADDAMPRRQCGTMPVHNRLATTSPEYRARRIAVEGFAKGFARALGMAPPMEDIIRIPVVVHVVHHTTHQNVSAAQINSQIAVLNRDFRRTNSDAAAVPAVFQPVAADAKIEFTLAVRDPNGGPTHGITRTQTSAREFHDDTDDIKFAASGGHDAWPSDRYLNLWVAPKIMDPDIGELLGYAQFPGGSANTDGVVLWYKCLGTEGTATRPYHLGRSATHEIGHWLNLLHVWGDDDGGCRRSDEVRDTPNQSKSNMGVPTYPNITCRNGPHGDMFMNYMDYSDDACLCLFTAGQVARMRAALLGPRASLLTSDGLTPPGAPAGFAPPLDPRLLPVLEEGEVPDDVFDGVGWAPAGEMGAQMRGVFAGPGRA